MSICASLDRKT